mmetsp:Transcript_21960/g.52706  ORF Transcript_21960/g.52706 Transcript_21960/m.52706 type:complete len:455 (+) Transcript_21960:293-1657(+)
MEDKAAELKRIHATAALVLEEYVKCQSSTDATVSVDEMGFPEHRPEFVQRVISASMQRVEAERGLGPQLLSSLVMRGALEPSDVEAGLEVALNNMEEAQKTAPHAVDYAAHAIAFFLEDKVVPETILKYVPTLAGDELGQKIVSKVTTQLQLPLPITKFKSAVREIVDEYFVGGEVKSAIEQLSDLKEARYGYEVVKRVLVMSLEKKDAEREMASVLLSGLTRVYGSEQFFEGFIRTLRGIDDLALDTPNVCHVLANFVARAIADDVLPPVFISLVPKRIVESGRGKEVSALVHGLLDQHGSSARIMNVWGVGSRRSVSELKESVSALVEEYYVEGELEEAVRCVRELGVPHFGHEVVKRAVYGAVERGGDGTLEKACLLITALVKAGVLEGAELTKGMSRALRGLPDLCLDVPQAAERMDRVIAQGVREGLLAEGFKERFDEMAGSVHGIKVA